MKDEETTQDDGENTRYKVKEGLLYYRNNWTLLWRLCVSVESTKRKLMYDHHSTAIAGHPGVDRTFGKLSRAFYWPRMLRDVPALREGMSRMPAYKIDKHGDAGTPAANADSYAPLARNINGFLRDFRPVTRNGTRLCAASCG